MVCCKSGRIDEIPFQEHLVSSEYNYLVKKYKQKYINWFPT